LAVVGLYLHPTDNPLVLSVDKKATIQDSDRSESRLPVKAHDLKRLRHARERNWAASLLAALETHTIQICGESIPCDNGETCVRFLRGMLHTYPGEDPHVVPDSSSSHRSKRTLDWARRQERIDLKFTPTRASWLNQIEIWLAILTRKVVQRGIFKSREELVARLTSFIEAYNEEGWAFQWIYKGAPLATRLSQPICPTVH
jgi:transposase